MATAVRLSAPEGQSQRSIEYGDLISDAWAKEHAPPTLVGCNEISRLAAKHVTPPVCPSFPFRREAAEGKGGCFFVVPFSSRSIIGPPTRGGGAFAATAALTAALHGHRGSIVRAGDAKSTIRPVR